MICCQIDTPSIEDKGEKEPTPEHMPSVPAENEEVNHSEHKIDEIEGQETIDKSLYEQYENMKNQRNYLKDDDVSN